MNARWWLLEAALIVLALSAFREVARRTWFNFCDALEYAIEKPRFVNERGDADELQGPAR